MITTTVKDSREQDVSLVSVVDDVALDNERASAPTELEPMATRARLFDEQFESIKDGVCESIGGGGAGILGNVGPDLLEVLPGQTADTTSMTLGASRTTARLDPLGELPTRGPVVRPSPAASQLAEVGCRTSARSCSRV
jgi:hypothetical protein